MRPGTQRNKGFTLIELLVTLGIIAVLIALLFPVLTSARKKGRQTVCLSNLRQIGQALNMYQQDYDTKLPHINPFWSAYNGTRPAFAGYDPLKTYGTMKGIYLCPELSTSAETNYNWRFQVDLRNYTQRIIPNPTFQNHKHVRLQPDSVVAVCYRHLDKGYQNAGGDGGFIYSPRGGREGIYQILRAQGNVQRIEASQVKVWGYEKVNGAERWFELAPNDPMEPWGYFDVFPNEPFPPTLD